MQKSDQNLIDEIQNGYKKLLLELGVVPERVNLENISRDDLEIEHNAITGQVSRRQEFLTNNQVRSIKSKVEIKSNNSEIVALYTDGGVIMKNPSNIGGTWAWCGVDKEGNRVIEKSGVIPSSNGREISNNHTEQIAITLALEAMNDGWSGLVYSDSMIALGRVFKMWREKNLPANISERSKAAVKRLGAIETVLLQGHPTKADLENGIGKKRNLPVSIHNVWCDKACSLEAKKYLEGLEIER